MNVLVVGAGLSGATLARLHSDNGDNVLVIDSRLHLAGNCYDYLSNDTFVHSYGPHIWHNSNEKVQEFVERFTEFNDYTHRVTQITDVGLLNYPLDSESMSFIYEKDYKDIEIPKIYDNPSNMEEMAINKIGKLAYELYVKHYTTRQWGYSPSELSPTLAARLGVTDKSNGGLFDKETYTGMPKLGYHNLVVNMLSSELIDVKLGVDFDKDYLNENYDKYDIIYYTGGLDELSDYCYGRLAYISVKFDTEIISPSDWKGTKSVQNISKEVSHTNRITNYNYFGYSDPNKVSEHIIMTEYPGVEDGVKCYPVTVREVEKMSKLYNQYKDKLKSEYPKLIPAGRLGLYQYLDMNKAIESSMKIYSDLMGE